MVTQIKKICKTEKYMC